MNQRESKDRQDLDEKDSQCYKICQTNYLISSNILMWEKNYATFRTVTIPKAVHSRSATICKQSEQWMEILFHWFEAFRVHRQSCFNRLSESITWLMHSVGTALAVKLMLSVLQEVLFTYVTIDGTTTSTVIIVLLLQYDVCNLGKRSILEYWHIGTARR